MSEPERPILHVPTTELKELQLAPAWREFILFCKNLKHGEIERLSIQDGVPILAELTKKKVKFNSRP